MARRSSRQALPTYDESAGSSFNVSRLITIVICVAAVGSLWRGLLGDGHVVGIAPVVTPLPGFPAAVAAALEEPESTLPPDSSMDAENNPDAVVPVVTSTPSVPRIGIVSGHWGSDTGAVCPDGLQEVDINYDVAQRVVAALSAQGYRIDLLQERDPVLNGYRAAVMVSIHADSCTEFPGADPPASGYKVARVVGSAVPEAEDRLVRCLSDCYGARTGLYFHENSITDDMMHYHAFYEIDGQTPGAIIETGFMFEDRDLLTHRADLVAEGIVDGILCFLQSEGLR
ncbi:MAG: N-acetylmuramoyl-L-alanine amidase [Anaerolineae bacterium]|nr:N-acetylmuramoyl-L-alanine amidase [Anaerolineae bacterium]